MTNADRFAGDTNLRTILATIADGVVVVDDVGTVRYANPAAAELFDVSADRLIGRQFGFPVVGGETTEIDLVRASGEPCVVEMRAVDGTWEGSSACIASLRDVTERRRAEAARTELIREQAARREAEAALRARDEFLALAAHELKTPLTRLRLSAQHAVRRLRREDTRTPPYVRRALDGIQREAIQLTRVVGQLIDMSRIDGGVFALHRDTVDLRGAVEAAVDAVSGLTDGYRLSTRLPDDPVIASVDRHVLEQVVADTIVAALRHSPSGGAIQVALSVVDTGSKPVARLTVHDEGRHDPGPKRPGAARGAGGNLEGDSERDYRAGTTLGNYVTRRMVELHDGELEVKPGPTSGTLVAITLPLARAVA